MKSVMIAAIAMATMTSAAFAMDRPTVLAYSEYATEAKTFEAGAGTEFVLGDKIVLTPMVIGFGTDKNFAFDRVEVKASYTLNQNVDLYAKVKSDSDMHYAETVVGVSLQF